MLIGLFSLLIMAACVWFLMDSISQRNRNNASVSFYVHKLILEREREAEQRDKNHTQKDGAEFIES